MPPKKKYDPDVWAPPPPLPVRRSKSNGKSTGEPNNNNTSGNQSDEVATRAQGEATAASAATSAFQRHFANRTEVVGQGNANAHLGVAAVDRRAPRGKAPPSSGLHAEKQGLPKRKKAATAFQILAPGESPKNLSASRQRASSSSHGTNVPSTFSAASALPAPPAQGVGSHGDLSRSNAETRLPPIRSTHRALNFNTPAVQASAAADQNRASNNPSRKGTEQSREVERGGVVEVEMENSESEGDMRVLPLRADVLQKPASSHAAAAAVGSPDASAASLSRRSSSFTVQAPGQQVKCLLAPSALAAASGKRQGNGTISSVGDCHGSENREFPFTPPPRSPPHLGAHRPPSTASSAPSYLAALTPLAHEPAAHAPNTLTPPPPSSLRSDAGTAAASAGPEPPSSAKVSKAPALPPQGARALPRAKPSASAPSLNPSAGATAHASNQLPARRSPASADAQLKPRDPSSTSVNRNDISDDLREKAKSSTATQKPSYTPYTLDSYKSLMADVASRKSGGLGPSDTDAQRAAREKLARARAYGKKAERHARQSIAGETGMKSVDSDAGPSDDAHCDERRREEKTTSARSASGSISSTSASTDSSSVTSSSTTTTSSSSSSSIEHHKRKQITKHHSRTAHERNLPVTAPTAVAATHTTTPPPSAAPSLRSTSPATPTRAHNEGTATATRLKPRRQTSATPSSPAHNVNAAGPAFAVAAASRKEAKEARKRRARALAYAQTVAQARQEAAAAAAKLADGAEVRRDGVGSDDMHEEEQETYERLGSSIDGGTAARAEEQKRRQRLMDLEAAHMRKKAAVDHIRCQLRRVGNNKGDS